MTPTILRMNATTVYRFLSFIKAKLPEGDALRGGRILDCGAGGRIPPLAIFAEQGMDCVGIDISEEQVEAARVFASESGLPLEFRVGDMREIPFPDASFDYVYEHFSMCHLSVMDTLQAVREMYRVLRPGGLAFFGVISSESWPISNYGEEREPGEYWMVEGGREVFHVLFSDAQARDLANPWEVLLKERAVLHAGGEETTKDEWAALRLESGFAGTAEEWMEEFDSRGDRYRYVHAYYYVRKPV